MERPINAGMQDTGNPVLDSVVNILQGGDGGSRNQGTIRSIHEVMLEIAQKEPGGLERRPGGNKVHLPDSEYESEVPKAAK